MGLSEKTGWIIGIVIFIVVVFSILGGLANDVTTSANSVTDANNCSDGVDTAGETLTYDQDTKFCVNSTAGQLYLAGQYDLPLNGLFGSSGVILLVMMSAFFLLILRKVMKKQ